MKEKEVKNKYDRPTVIVKSVAVEDGMQVSIHTSHPEEPSNVTTSQYGSASWDN